MKKKSGKQTHIIITVRERWMRCGVSGGIFQLLLFLVLPVLMYYLPARTKVIAKQIRGKLSKSFVHYLQVLLLR
jgi:hypothetical protein